VTDSVPNMKKLFAQVGSVNFALLRGLQTNIGRLRTMLRDSKKKKKEKKRRVLSERLALEELSEMVDSKGVSSESVKVGTNLGEVLKAWKDDV
jgi:hypothetical protein